jgi:CPA1 family monovalent cation:H+ antiporter
MKLVTISLVLLSLVSLSVIASLAFRIPLPLLQVAFGIVLFTLFRIHIAIEPSLFLLLFIAPLLYVDAYQFPRAEFFRLRRSILVMSVGLVILTVLGVGYFVHWMIPTVPLSVCFALAAVLSPTDAVAVTGSLRGEAIPARLLYLLRGEALFNDASGLVCFRLAIAATLTGSFSVAAASLTFLIVSVGGLAVGTLLSYIVMRFQIWMEKSTRSHSTAQILLTLLLPFAAYASAEYLKVSGVLAAVGAGFVGKWVLKISAPLRRVFKAKRSWE